MSIGQGASASDADIERAARRLLEGRLVAFPTETVYGLGADAQNEDAIARIYTAKGRPAGHPLIVHLAPGADVGYWSPEVTPAARRLMAAFWPGPLTLILRRAAHIPPAVSGGQDTIGLRCPSHPVAQALLRRFAALRPGGHGGLAAPSANRFGRVSPTTARHVRDEFPHLNADELQILEGGPSDVGIESTIVDVSDPARQPVLLRPGHIGPDALAAVLGAVPGAPLASSPQVSGSLKAHYAPRTPLTLCRPGTLMSAARHHARQGPVAIISFAPPAPFLPDRVSHVACAAEPGAYARDLYALLRRLDEQGYARILVEQPPQTPQWQAVNDRLERAAAAFSPQAAPEARPRC